MKHHVPPPLPVPPLDEEDEPIGWGLIAAALLAAAAILVPIFF